MTVATKTGGGGQGTDGERTPVIRGGQSEDPAPGGLTGTTPPGTTPADEGGDGSSGDPDLLTVAQVALLLRVTPMTIYRLTHAGSLKSERVGRSIRISRRALIAHLRRQSRDSPQPERPRPGLEST